MIQDLCRGITDEEVRATAFQLGATKALGSDGYQGILYQSYWGIMGPEITEAIKNFLKTYSMPCELNCIEITLFPKCSGLEIPVRCRPISLCHYVFKIISNILVSRLRPFLPSLILPQQSAFVSGRVIRENVMVAHEVFHHLKGKRKGKRAKCALKIDMTKAYD